MTREPDAVMASHPKASALRTELMTLLSALWYDIDHNLGSRAATYFTADATLRFVDAEFRGTAEIEQVYSNRRARGARVSRHVVTNLHLTAMGEDQASGTSLLILYGEDGVAPRPRTTPAMIGDVHDEFRRVDGRWLIESRGIDYLFIEPDTQLAVPSSPEGKDQS